MKPKLTDTVIGDVINKNKEKKYYKYSIITPAYNVEDYIVETVESVFNQTWLKNNPGEVQMVVVNDGSNDGTLEVLKLLAEKYDDLLVVNKSNSGVSDSRNLGAKFAKGEYWNFLDSDDKISDNVLEEADRVFNENKDLKLFKMNRQFFEKITGFVEYYMKDLKTSQIIDVQKTPQYAIIHVASFIFHHDIWEDEMFPSQVIYGEDAWVAGIMLEKSSRIYYSFEATYLYRKRYSETSLVDQHKGDDRKYIGQLENYYVPFLELIEKRFGAISGHSQTTIMYSLSWNLKNRENYPLLDEEYVEVYIKKLSLMLKKFDDKVIMSQQRIMNYYLRHSLIVIKETGELPKNSHFYPTSIGEVRGNKVPVVNNFTGNRVECFEGLPIRVTVLKSIQGNISFVGRFNTIFDLKFKENFKFYARNSRGDIYNFKTEVPMQLKSYYFMNTELKKLVGFAAEIPGEFFSQSEYVEFIAAILVDGDWYETVCHADFIGHFAWLVNREPGSFFIHDNTMVSYDKGKKKLLIEPYTTVNVKKKEQIFKNDYKSNKNEKNILFWRKLSNFVRNRNRKKGITVNMYMDRDSGIWDNATSLILKHNELLREKEIKKTKNYFILSKEAEGYNELKKLGVKVIPFKSFRHKLLMVSADRLISSQANITNYNPFRSEWKNKLNDKQCFEYDYLQHGVSLRKTASVMRPWMTKTGLGIDKIIAGNELEYKYLSSGVHGNEFLKSDVYLIGQSRHDYLEIKEDKPLSVTQEKKLLVMPTWRQNLTKRAGGEYVYNPVFHLSDHFKVWNEFLANEKLHKLLKKKNIKLVFAPHPLEQVQLIDYDLKYVDEVVKSSTNYNELINEVDGFVTDFSSLGLDFFYGNKPIFILDTEDDNWENFDEEISYQNGSFGPVAKDVDRLIEKMSQTIENDFEITDEIKAFRNEFFRNELNVNISEEILKAFKII